MRIKKDSEKIDKYFKELTEATEYAYKKFGDFEGDGCENSKAVDKQMEGYYSFDQARLNSFLAKMVEFEEKYVKEEEAEEEEEEEEEYYDDEEEYYDDEEEYYDDEEYEEYGEEFEPPGGDWEMYEMLTNEDGLSHEEAVDFMWEEY